MGNSSQNSLLPPQNAHRAGGGGRKSPAQGRGTTLLLLSLFGDIPCAACRASFPQFYATRSFGEALRAGSQLPRASPWCWSVPGQGSGLGLCSGRRAHLQRRAQQPKPPCSPGAGEHLHPPTPLGGQGGATGASWCRSGTRWLWERGGTGAGTWSVPPPAARRSLAGLAGAR